MSPVRRARRVFGDRFPRVSGDEPNARVFGECNFAFSPRERG